MHITMSVLVELKAIVDVFLYCCHLFRFALILVLVEVIRTSVQRELLVM